MKPATRALLEKLSRSRPKPSKVALQDLFMTIKDSPIDELLALCLGHASPEIATSSPSLEADVKRRLREVGGKSSDFSPYLLEQMQAQSISVREIGLKKSSSIAEILRAMELALGDQSASAVRDALQKYVTDYDVGYKLKTA